MAQQPQRDVVPKAGAFAVVTIDAIASLEYLDDPQATDAAAGLVCKGYLVYVSGTQSLHNPAVAFREEEVYFVIQGLPMDVPWDFMESAMSIPIFPATEHPTARPPLQPTTPFPLPKCYLSPFVHNTVRCPSFLMVDPVVYALDADEQARFARMVKEDEERRKELHSRGASASDAGGSEKTAVDTAATWQVDGADFSAPLEERASWSALFRKSLQKQKEADDDLTTVNFTHDLSRLTVDDAGYFNNPNGFFDEVAQIERIARESLARRDERDALSKAKARESIARTIPSSSEEESESHPDFSDTEYANADSDHHRVNVVAYAYGYRDANIVFPGQSQEIGGYVASTSIQAQADKLHRHTSTASSAPSSFSRITRRGKDILRRVLCGLP